jgi:radical SAM superfamily enzyme YgiQ (UPF0313 family)
MRVLLIAPGEFRQRNTEFFSLYRSLKKLRVLPSLGLCCLSAVLKKERFEARLLDAYAEDLTAEEFLDRVAQYDPNIVGVTSTTPFFQMTARTCSLLKQRRPDLKIILGGPHVTVMKEAALLLDTVDYGVIGEGEVTLVRLLRALESGEPLEAVPNLVFRRGGEIILTDRVDYRQSLDELPPPDRTDLPLGRYYDSLSLHHRAMSMMSSRGCPFTCLFCEADVRGGVYRHRSVELVLEEMRHIVEDLGFREIVIYDDTFTVNRKRTVALCEGILRMGLNVAWDCRTRVDRVDLELLRLMKHAGCHRISYGVEAASPRVREVLRKQISDAQIRDALEWSRRAGIRTIAYFMIGSPTETREEILKTIDYAVELKPDISHFCITAPYPGTDLYRLGVSEGSVPPDFWEEYLRCGGAATPQIPYFTSGGLTRTELDHLLGRAYRKFYLRPGYVWNRLRSVSSLRDLLWNAKLAKELALLAM